MKLLAPLRAVMMSAFFTVTLLPVSAETIVLEPSQDTTIYAENGNLSNGAGVGLFAGRTQGSLGTTIRRALLRFDVSGIPSGATIESVTLSLAKQLGAASSLSLHRLEQIWGESGSNAGLPGGRGATAQPNDATWTRNLLLTQSWTTPGGTFVSASSASAPVASGSQRYEWQSATMTDDVSAWLENSSQNFGWILIGAESTSQSAQRFGSRESSDPPQLTIMWSTAEPTRTLTLSAASPGGEVSGGGEFSDGALATIIATPSPGFEFLQWFGEGITDPSSAITTVLMSADRDVSAEFRQIPGVAISVIASPDEGGIVTGGGTFVSETAVPISATPNSGYRFDRWQGNGIDDLTQAQTTIIAAEGNSATAVFVKVWTINVTSNDETLGTVTGSNVVDDGEQITLTAAAEVGSRFVRWASESGQTFTDAVFTLMASADLNLAAEFVRQHTLSITADPETGGSANGAGTFDEGADAPIEAVPAEGYRFAVWIGDGVADPASALTTIEMSDDRSVTAQFIKVWPLTLASDPVDGGDVIGGGIFDDGTEATISATATEGSRFVRWQGDGITDPDNATTTVVLTEARSVTALFVSVWDLTVVSSNEGSRVTGEGTFDDATEAPITATAADGFRFAGWEGDGIADPESATTTVMMTEARNVIAVFVRLRELSIAASPEEGGTATGAGTFDNGSEATITATAADGFRFVSWQGDGVADPNSPNTSVLMTDARTVVAEFIRVWPLTVNADPSGGGEVRGAGTFDDGSEATITATAAEGFRFVRWQGAGVADPNSADTNVLMTGARTVVAEFIRVWPLTVDASHAEGGEVTGAGTFDDGSEATITATAAEGFRFVRWQGDGVADPNSPDTSVLMTDARTVVAEFIRVWPLTVDADPAEGGEVTGAFDDGSEATITATAAEGFRFLRWQGDGVADPNSPDTSVLMTDTRTVVAEFIRVWPLTVDADPAEGGEVTGAGTFDDGSEATITATAAEGSRFVRWQGAGVADPNSADTNVLMTGARSVVAEFIRVWPLTVDADPAEGGEVTGAGSFDDGTETSISATPAEGFQFGGWEGNGIADSNNANTTVSMPEPRNVIARFEIVEADADRDGLDDAWERENGLDPNDPLDALTDLDRDGKNNLEEFQAGTDPNDPTSALVIRTVSIGGNGNLEIAWSSVIGRRYVVESSADLQPESWIDVVEILASAEQSSTRLPIDGEKPADYLRIRVVAEPLNN